MKVRGSGDGDPAPSRPRGMGPGALGGLAVSRLAHSHSGSSDSSPVTTTNHFPQHLKEHQKQSPGGLTSRVCCASPACLLRRIGRWSLMYSPASCWCVNACDQIMDIDLTSDARRGSVEADDDDDDGEGGSSSANEEEEELMGAPPPEAQPVKVGRLLFWDCSFWGPSCQTLGS